MTDIDIIRLLWIRDEIAIEELEINYGHYCRQISWEIVQNREDVSECLNDTWWKTWCSIPENRPDSLRAYVARITRNLSLNKIIHNKAWKRGYGKISVIDFRVCGQCCGQGRFCGGIFRRGISAAGYCPKDFQAFTFWGMDRLSILPNHACCQLRYIWS